MNEDNLDVSISCVSSSSCNHLETRGNKKKLKKLNKAQRKNSKFLIGMSSWAENFTVAATWQLKNEIAYWKAKAKALECENKVLHNVIRNTYGASYTSQDSQNSAQSESESDEDLSDTEPRPDSDYQPDGCHDAKGEEEDFVVSEEFIEFVKENAKFKEDARREREILKAKEAEALRKEEMDLELQHIASTSVKASRDFYGDHWDKIWALETSLHVDFISECDQTTPEYWPNIPFNFNFS